ncbi:MAG: hypothetical protein D6753_13840 [Planctomycetota bacterium]|nr:MAG: hypothetical protein D6753_13840 [Planctomycetota bacterium]
MPRADIRHTPDESPGSDAARRPRTDATGMPRRRQSGHSAARRILFRGLFCCLGWMVAAAALGQSSVDPALPPTRTEADAIGPQEVAELLERVRRSRDENARRLQSAYGSGRLTYRIDEVGEPTVTALDSDIQFFYDRPKFRVHLAHNVRLQENVRPAGELDEDFRRWTPSDLTEQVIVYDGDKLVSVEFRAGQCTGEIYFGFARLAVLRAAGFPFEDPVTLWSQAINLDSSDPRELRVIPLDGGGFVGILQKSTYFIKLTFLDKFGYDLRRVSSIRNGEARPFRDYLLQWEQRGDVFFVQRFVNTVSSAARDTASSAASSRQLSVEYTQFEANVQVSPDVFSLSSVVIPPGTEFLDKRSNVEGGPKRLLYQDGELVPVTH